MNDTGAHEAHQRVAAVLEGMGDAVIALSGGVDSMTLAHIGAGSGARVEMYHAVSPAVPPHATARVREHAHAHGWDLRVVGAGEFDDPAYMANPINRCYFCKSNLYARLAEATEAAICSGTNTDDLGDFRPGLGAAAERGVRHPFVEAGIDKAMIRRIARDLDLDDLADLPAQPCLSSRIETGLAIDAGDLALIDRVEQVIAERLGPGDIRCRVTRAGLRIEVPPGHLGRMGDPARLEIEQEIAGSGHALAGIGTYRRGSAFLREAGE